MKIMNLLKSISSTTTSLFLIIFTTVNLLAAGCSDNKLQYNAASKPTSAASPSATPKKFTSSDVITVFKEANLEVVSPRPIEKSKNQDFSEVEGTEFSIPSAGKNMTGRVFSYQNAVDAAEATIRSEGIAELFEENNKFDTSLYQHFNYKNLMVQISRRIPKEKAKLYFDALLKVK